jgi:hypothetical protein
LTGKTVWLNKSISCEESSKYVERKERWAVDVTFIKMGFMIITFQNIRIGRKVSLVLRKRSCWCNAGALLHLYRETLTINTRVSGK